MITPLRRRHRWLAPLSFALALVALGAALAARPTGFAAAHGGRDAPATGAGLRARLSPDGRVVRVALGADVVGPDLAFYGAASPAEDGALPPDAVFLAKVDAGREAAIAVRPVAGLDAAPGFVLVHSLGWDRVVAGARVARSGAPTGDGAAEER